MDAAADEALARRVAAALPVRSPPGLPEVLLHLAGPGSRLAALCAEAGSEAAPYWAHVWGGGLALARFLFDHPRIARGRRVVDLGAGGGVAALAAAMTGAARVVAVDLDPLAAVTCRLNAGLNGMALATVVGDALDGVALDAELVLAGDLFYEAGLAMRAGAFLAGSARAGKAVLIGDPGRATFSPASFPGAKLRRLSESEGADFGARARLSVYAVETA